MFGIFHCYFLGLLIVEVCIKPLSNQQRCFSFEKNQVEPRHILLLILIPFAFPDLFFLDLGFATMMVDSYGFHV